MTRSSELGSLFLRVQAACHSKPMTALQGANRSTEHATLKLPFLYDSSSEWKVIESAERYHNIITASMHWGPRCNAVRRSRGIAQLGYWGSTESFG